MPVAFMLIGVVMGLGAGLTAWSTGAGLGMAVLAYTGSGALGTLLAAGLTLVTRRQYRAVARSGSNDNEPGEVRPCRLDQRPATQTSS